MKIKEISNSPSSPSGIPYFLILLIFISCLSRFFLIGRESLWLDEVDSIRIAGRVASLHLEKFIFFSRWHDPHPVLYYFVLYIWIKLFGIGETALRALSAVFGILLVVSTYYVGKKAISREAGIIASILLLVNPVALYYSQETRMYTLIPLLILLSTYYFYEFLSNRSRKFAILYILFSVLLIYTDYLGTLVLVIHFSFLLFSLCSTAEKRALMVVFLAYPVILLLYIPWLPNALLRLNWGLIAWMKPPGLTDVIIVALHLLGIGFSHPGGIDLSGSPLGMVVFVLLGIWGSLILSVGLLISFRERRTFKTLLAMLCFMPLIMVLISIIRAPIFNLRQASVYFPEIALTMATGFLALVHHVPKRWNRFLPRRAWLLFMTPLLLAGLISMYRVYSLDKKENWRKLAADMEEIGADRPIYICQWYQVRSFTYYYGGSASVTGIKYEDVLLLSHSSDANELIFITSHIDPSSVIAILEQDFRVQKELQYRGARVHFLQRNTGNSRPEQAKESITELRLLENDFSASQ